MWHEEEKTPETSNAIQEDKLELLARRLRYPFLLLTIAIFMVANLKAFNGNEVGMWLFFVSGLLWMVSAAYIDIREQTRIGLRLKAAKSREITYSRKQGENKMIKWVRKYAAVTAVLVVLGAAITLYVIRSNPSKPWWGLILVAVGPVATWLASRVQRKGRDNENLVRQLGPMVKDAGDLEFTIRSFARELVNKPEIQSQLGGGAGVHGWLSYIESNGAWQLDELSSLKTDLKKADPFDPTQLINIITSFYRILGRTLEIESRLVGMCQNFNNLPPDALARWENIQQMHLRLGTQLSGLKPVLNEMGRVDLFDTFINQPPQNLKPTV